MTETTNENQSEEIAKAREKFLNVLRDLAEKKAGKKSSTKRSRSRGSLVIVESPAKARTIGKYLGSEYTVKATVGHLRDLPQRELGVDIENGFIPKYVTIRGKGKNLAELKKAAKGARSALEFLEVLVHQAYDG